MKNSASNESVIRTFRGMGHFFFLHHKMIYFVVFFCVLGGGVISLNLALNQPSNEAYRAEKLSEAQSPRFDEETIEKIQGLNARQQTNTEAPPTGQRINPFGE